mgnify:FL=1
MHIYSSGGSFGSVAPNCVEQDIPPDKLVRMFSKAIILFGSSTVMFPADMPIMPFASFGQKSHLDVMGSKADLLRSAWQLASAEKAFRDALDALSIKFVYIDEK